MEAWNAKFGVSHRKYHSVDGLNSQSWCLVCVLWSVNVYHEQPASFIKLFKKYRMLFPHICIQMYPNHNPVQKKYTYSHTKYIRIQSMRISAFCYTGLWFAYGTSLRELLGAMKESENILKYLNYLNLIKYNILLYHHHQR